MNALGRVATAGLVFTVAALFVVISWTVKGVRAVFEL